LTRIEIDRLLPVVLDVAVGSISAPIAWLRWLSRTDFLDVLQHAQLTPGRVIVEADDLPT
jgi:hypothetical protein